MQLGQDFQNHEVGLELGEILRDLPLPERIVEGVVDGLGGNAETGRLVAVDGDLKARSIGQKVARDVGKLWQRLQLVQKLLRPFVQLFDCLLYTSRCV